MLRILFPTRINASLLVFSIHLKNLSFMIRRLFSETLSAENSVALDLSATNLELNPSIYGNV